MTEASLIQGVNAAFIGVSDPQAHIDFYWGHFKEESLRQQTFTSMAKFKIELNTYIH